MDENELAHARRETAMWQERYHQDVTLVEHRLAAEAAQTKPIHASLALRWILLAAFAAMFAQDVLGTAMVIFEAHYDAARASVMDQLQWMTAIVSQGLTIESIIKNGWKAKRTWAIFFVVSCANILGTYSGVAIARAFA